MKFHAALHADFFGGRGPSCILSCILSCCLGLGSVSRLAAAETLVVHTDFEGGSARVESIDQSTRTIRFFPAGDPLRGWPCWWYLRVDGAEVGEKVFLELGASPQIADQGPLKGKQLSGSWAMADQAALSYDDQHWEHTQPGQRRDDRMVYEVTPKATTFWLAWGPPFTPRHAATLVERLDREHHFVSLVELATSREERKVQGLVFREQTTSTLPRFGVWIQARQHAWESGSSWVARGLGEWLASADADAIWLREHAEVVVIPVMDVDHVASGDGGKEAFPQDHNRDWSDEPHWPEVAAAQKRLLDWVQERRLDVFVDLHNPGPNDRKAFFYVGPEELLAPIGRRNRSRFLELAAQHICGPIPLAERPKPSGAGYHPLWKQMSGNWVNSHGNPHTVSVCLETAWNTPHSVTDNYQLVGQQLGKTIAAYLK